MDGSQKIPQRWLQTLEDNRAAGRQCPALLKGIAAWLAHLRGSNQDRYGPVEDPRAAQLAAAIKDKVISEAAEALFSLGGAMGGVWSITKDDSQQISRYVELCIDKAKI
jgi:fructuronate reductase